jgi:hypothetical protein
MTLCDVIFNADVLEDPTAIIIGVLMMKEPRTSENWAFVYKSARHHIQHYRICTVAQRARLKA